MNAIVKLSKIGNSAGVLLTRDVVAHLGAELGDQLSLSITPDGIEIKPFRADFEAQMAAARDVMDRRKRALRELAK